MIDTVDLVGTADSLVIKMSSGSPAEVVSLARYLADLARRGNFFEVAEAADAVERAATEAGPKRLAPPIRQLSTALDKACTTLQAA